MAAVWRFQEAPTSADAPTTPIRGQDANGTPMEIKTVVFEPGSGEWTLRLGDQPLSDPTFPHLKGQHISIDLPKGTPAAGSVWSKKLKSGGAMFQIIEGKGSLSWNSDNAWFIQIDAWEAKPYDPKGAPYQVAGKASGKVYVAFKGDSTHKDCGVAGVFKDAVVRYIGKPQF